MKKMMLLALSFLLFITGCSINGVPFISVGVPVVEVRPVTVEVAAPDLSVQYDDPGRGWYIDGYWTPAHVWVAPFWTTDVYVLHDHFSYYRGGHRDYFERDHFRREDFRRDLSNRHERSSMQNRRGERGRTDARPAQNAQNGHRSEQRNRD